MINYSKLRLFQNAVDPFLTVLQNSLPAEVLQHPQQLAVADVKGFGQAADICNALAVVGILEGQRHPLFQRHLHRGGHGAVELGGQAGAEIPQKSRVVEQNLLILLQIKGQGIYIRPGLHKEGGKLGIHKTDLIQFLLGQKVVRTTARLATLDKRGEDGELIGVDDNAVCIYEMSGGAFGTMTASWTYYGAEDNSTVLYGTKGIMRIYDDPAHSIVVKLADGQEQVYDVEQIQTNDNQTKSGVIDLWVDCLKNNRAPEISGESALYAMRAVFASIESSQTGKTVEIGANK